MGGRRKETGTKRDYGMTAYSLLIEKIQKGKNPYEGFPVDKWRGVWYGDPGAQRNLIDQSIANLRPSLIIEVGSFVGESAIHMAKQIKIQSLDCAILCVDTWCAGFDHHVGAPEKLNMHFGRSDLFYRFMANVIEHNCQDVIVPFAMDSIGAARVIKWLGLVPTLIYVDASHEKGDVIRDYDAYWDLLPKGGGMLVDDLTAHFPGVIHDWNEFLVKNELTATTVEGEKGLVIKP